MQPALILLTACLLLLSGPSSAFATEEYAVQTGADCIHCHLDPAGGGELTAVGDGYLLALAGRETADGELVRQSLATKVLRLAVGYLHILTGFFWFGTILYVHLVLKPAYASQGLPRGEVKVGLASIAIMAATGILLTMYRVPSLEFLVTTRFGVLLLIKVGLFLIMVGSALFVVLCIGPRLRQAQRSAAPETGDLTLDQLGYFDGKEGRKTYFAYQGKIFDATHSKRWQDGTHMARHAAGTDLTAALAQAPHGEERIQAMPEVGRLVASPPLSSGLDHRKVFFFMAYMNLTFVLLIVLILALWRWSL